MVVGTFFYLPIFLFFFMSDAAAATPAAAAAGRDWGNITFVHCVQPYTWTELVQNYKTNSVFFKTGGLGELQREGIYTWQCFKDHYCATGPEDPWFCFVYDEVTSKFIPWGPNSELQLVVPSERKWEGCSSEIEALSRQIQQLKNESSSLRPSSCAGSRLYIAANSTIMCSPGFGGNSDVGCKLCQEGTYSAEMHLCHSLSATILIDGHTRGNAAGTSVWIGGGLKLYHDASSGSGNPDRMSYILLKLGSAPAGCSLSANSITKAQMKLYKTWDGSADGWSCSEHKYQIRLASVGNLSVYDSTQVVSYIEQNFPYSSGKQTDSQGMYVLDNGQRISTYFDLSTTINVWYDIDVTTFMKQVVHHYGDSLSAILLELRSVNDGCLTALSASGATSPIFNIALSDSNDDDMISVPTSCVPCPPNFTSPAGSSSIQACKAAN
ncbi:hypothetical protein GUITHDRAFT_137228 [Guillardia theta CCMP2712]|uniref:Uncharacterized protein n=1 Tax=Guillardia theta (strain CCMP2712) TaxID=905079 RepID=L1JI91_GUITC|nr:hypothetical protein GUITHDRAFT_137228 [Guillardia theta CCMP2712]EKX47854.1 hypothetical protein GUITHDRAFT_137228 [Guillardia theta CCMP2712]|eukprot:XP_005834834.1 hypothetical protein GUITHDRAFT_137228 [Guillardia theta CCMP2712]